MSGYPTLKFFKGFDAVDYDGPRTAQGENELCICRIYNMNMYMYIVLVSSSRRLLPVNAFFSIRFCCLELGLVTGIPHLKIHLI